MGSASFVPHMNHVSVSPTNGNGPTQGKRKTLTRVGIEPTTFAVRVRSPLLYRLGYKVRREQTVGTEDVKVTAMNMYKNKEGLRFYKSWPWSTLYFNRLNWLECNVKGYVWTMWALALLMEMGPHKDREKLWPRLELNPPRPSGGFSGGFFAVEKMQLMQR